MFVVCGDVDSGGRTWIPVSVAVLKVVREKERKKEREKDSCFNTLSHFTLYFS